MVGLRLHDTLAGAVTTSETVPVNPLFGVIVILVDPELPVPILMEPEMAEIAKSGMSVRITETITIVVCESDFVDPSIVTA